MSAISAEKRVILHESVQKAEEETKNASNVASMAIYRQTALTRKPASKSVTTAGGQGIVQEIVRIQDLQEIAQDRERKLAITVVKEGTSPGTARPAGSQGQGPDQDRDRDKDQEKRVVTTVVKKDMYREIARVRSLQGRGRDQENKLATIVDKLVTFHMTAPLKRR